MVGPDGSAPSSLAYQASALLLSYEPAKWSTWLDSHQRSPEGRHFYRVLGLLLPDTRRKQNWWSQGDVRPRFRNANAVSCYSTMAPEWCPRSVARRLPLLGRQPCISQHLSGKYGCRTACAFSGKMVDRVSVALTSNSLPGNLASTEHDGPKWWKRRAMLPHGTACKAAAVLSWLLSPEWTRVLDFHQCNAVLRTVRYLLTQRAVVNPWRLARPFTA